MKSVKEIERTEKAGPSQLLIYGAKSLALGICSAIQELYPEYTVKGFIVKSLQDNISTLAGLPVWELKDVNEKEIRILIATPEDIHEEIIQDLKSRGFLHYISLDSRKESKLMEKYFDRIGRFPSIHSMNTGYKSSKLCVYMAKFCNDKALRNVYDLPEWIQPLQVGAALGGKISGAICDNMGENISKKNGNYCELTALYWMWKNRAQSNGQNVDEVDYYGLFHYRRILDVAAEDILRLQKNDIDVVLPYPTLHEPDIYEHHVRYVKETDWKALCRALEELRPEYAKAFPLILSQPYLYNYNMLIAKRSVLCDYCAWLFPILERTEELSIPKGNERSDRYIGYLGENLMTLYFMYHQNDLNIAHTGRYMLI